jgi:hypothetical protein
MPTGVKANVPVLDAGRCAEPGCQAEVTPGVSPAAAGLTLLLPPTEGCGALRAPTGGVKGGGDGSDDSVCRAAAPAAVLCVGRSAKGCECGE